MKIWYKTLLIIFLALISGSIFLSSAYAIPLRQDPRPTASGGGGGGGNGSGSSNGSGGGPSGCTSLVGQVLQWGIGGFGGIPIELKNGSWQLSTLSATDGKYGFGGLGTGVATLHIEAPATTQTHIQDAAIYLSCEAPLVVNVAVYGGPRITPPATIAMSAPPKLVPGQNTVVRLVVKNTLPTPISQVVVTDLFPAGLTPVEVKIADGSGAAQIVDAGDKGQLVFVNLGSLPAGGVENILITVAVAKNFAAAPVKNTATLFYRESAADQVTMEFNSGATGSENEVAPAAVPETATPVPPGRPPLCPPKPLPLPPPLRSHRP
jgi:uncharacterized repeat protein (TIGR01451 family)